MCKISALTALFTTVLLCFCCLAYADEKSSWEDDGTLRILAIGPSFAQDCIEKMPDVLDAVGIESYEVAYVWIGNSTIEQHLSNMLANNAAYEYCLNTNGQWKKEKGWSIKRALEDRSWDFVTVQQNCLSAGMEGGLDNLEELIKQIRSICPDVTLGYNMCWSYTEICNITDFIENYGSDPALMYRMITEEAQAVLPGLDEISIVIPTATAVQNARQTHLGDNVYNIFRDATHLSHHIGRPMVAMTTLAALTNVDVSPAVSVFIMEKDGLAALESVQNALAHPYTVTPSSYQSTMGSDIFQTSDHYGDNGGWMICNQSSYIWTANDERAQAQGFRFVEDETAGRIVELHIGETGEIGAAYVLIQPVAMRDYWIDGSFQVKLFAEEAFPENAAIRIAIASGTKRNLDNSLQWVVDCSSLKKGWNQLTLPMSQASDSGEFKITQFKFFQIELTGCPNVTIRLAEPAICAP